MTSQGADERRIRSLLIGMGVGPAAVPPQPATITASPAPAGDPSDTWWDNLYADEAKPAAPELPASRLPDWWAPKPETLPDPTTAPAPAAETAPTPAVPDPVTPPTSSPPPTDPPPGTPPAHPAAQPPAQRHTPPQSLLDAWAAIRPRSRWLIHHATAATAGWPLGLVDWGTNTAAWYAAGHWTTPSAWVLYGLGLCALSLYRRARAWAWPLAWAATIPIASTTLGVLLYAPTT
ncbi:hypothetical protein [Streptomyces sp. STCH 565 A]|uniref:hypothetical protein n=1 Tax=Streptomyces sp. STCH 565 A TaxID=2950532 RepID=UPI0020757BB8|nr:hypothetical protein [Streptomyces sp. STCH 565 A]MCM8555363.1 hypothetical protein [Streptomyces sp. STCH 565 A]